MKAQRLLVVLTVLNLVLLALLLTQTRIHDRLPGCPGLDEYRWVSTSAVARSRSSTTRARTRAAINLHQADQSAAYPETVILRLVDPNGRPSVKLSTSERGGLLALGSEAQETYVQLSGRELTVAKDGRRQAIP